MEGLIPFVYKTVICRYRNGDALPSSLGLLFSNELPTSGSYMRLSSGDSDRHVVSEFQLFPPSPRASFPPAAGGAAGGAAGATQSIAAEPAPAKPCSIA